MSLNSFLHIVKLFQVLLYNSHNLRSVICLHLVCSIWPQNRTLLGATTSGQSGPGSNDNEGILYIPQISKTRSSPSDGLMSYEEHSFGGGSAVLLLCWDTVSVFYSPSQLGCYSLVSDCSMSISRKYFNSFIMSVCFISVNNKYSICQYVEIIFIASLMTMSSKYSLPVNVQRNIPFNLRLI